MDPAAVLPCWPRPPWPVSPSPAARPRPAPRETSGSSSPAWRRARRSPLSARCCSGCGAATVSARCCSSPARRWSASAHCAGTRSAGWCSTPDRCRSPTWRAGRGSCWTRCSSRCRSRWCCCCSPTAGCRRGGGGRWRRSAVAVGSRRSPCWRCAQDRCPTRRTGTPCHGGGCCRPARRRPSAAPWTCSPWPGWRCSPAAAGSLALRYRRLRPRRPPTAAAARAGRGARRRVAARATGAGSGAGRDVGFVAAVALGFPLALAVGALRYRVWELDRVLVATLVYGMLTAAVTAVYVGVVLAFAAATGSSAPAVLPSVLATALVAVAFAPVKERLSRVAGRLVLGPRADPYRALAALPHRLADAPAADEVLPRTADALVNGLGVPAARVRAFLLGSPNGSDQPAAEVAWAPGPPREDRTLVRVPVQHLGELVGDVAVAVSPDRPLSTADRRLLADLAAQAGPALRGVALAAELQRRLDQITEQAAQLRRQPAAHRDRAGRRATPAGTRHPRRRAAAAHRARRAPAGRAGGHRPGGECRGGPAVPRRAGWVHRRPARARPRHLPAGAGQPRARRSAARPSPRHAG